MTKRQASNWGKRLFILGLVVFALGSPFGWWFYIWGLFPNIGALLFIIPGIGFALIILAFVFLAYGSRVGDEKN